MTRSRRRKIFYGLVVLFIILGGGVVLYALGWRLDFSTFKVNRVGGIFVRSFPPEAQIYLDGKEVPNKSGLFGNGTLIGNLFPKTYDLKLAEAGFDDWRESVVVEPTLVANLKYAVLVPNNPFPLGTSTVQDFRLHNSELVLQNGGVWRLSGQRIGQGNIAGETNDSNYFLVVNPQNNNYFLRNMQSGALTDINTVLNDNGLNTQKPFSAIIDPTNGKSLAIGAPKRIYSLDVGTLALSTVARSTSTLNFGKNVSISQFFWAWTVSNPQSGTSTLVIYDKFLGAERPATTQMPTENAALQWADNNRLGVLQTDGELYIYNVLNDSLEKVADDAKDFTFSPDGKMLAVLENKSVEVFTYDGSGNYYRFNLPDIGSVQKLAWYFDDNHLFVVYPDRVSFLDLADTAIRNFTTVSATSRAEYDEANNILYFLDSNLVKKLEFPK